MTKIKLIPDEQQNRMMREANQFKRAGGTHEEFIKMSLDFPRKSALSEIYDLRDLYKKLRRSNVEKISDEEKEKLFSMTHSYNHFFAEGLTKKQREKVYLIYGKALKMLRAFDEYDISNLSKKHNAHISKPNSHTERDRQGTRHTEKANGRSRF